MGSYLEGYGAEQARRGRLVRRLALAGLVFVVTAGTVHLARRCRPAQRQVNLFLENLRKQDYQAAYRQWGCTEASPCRDYTFQMFLDDWGPKSVRANAAAAQIKKIKARTCRPGVVHTLAAMAAHGLGERGCDCGSGVILTVSFPKDEEVALWYERKDRTIGFSPFPVCVPQPRPFQ